MKGAAPHPGARAPAGYPWFAAGDINGFFALASDNLALLAGMSGILVGVFGMPVDIVLGRMVPGSALGVLAGDALYAVLAFRLARRSGRPDVCAMPLGIDTPSMFALSLGVVGPTFAASGDAQQAWQVGMAVLFIMGVVKLATAFLGSFVRTLLPRTALLGALAAVALAFIMFFPLRTIFAEPVGGIVALGVTLLTLVGGVRLPWRIPAILGSIVLGGLALWVALHLGYRMAPAVVTAPDWTSHWPWPTLEFRRGLELAWRYVPLAIPLALATVVGGIDNTESAALAGDAYGTRSILLVEAVATILAALAGGVVQTTPYIGHPAYKAMGCRSGYVLATGLFIGVGAALGLIGHLIALVPDSLIVPVLVFVGLEMSSQAILTCEPRHVKALALALMPVLGYLVTVSMTGVLSEAHVAASALSAAFRADYAALVMLGNGFIVTAMLWAAWLIWVTERRYRAAAAVCAAAALLSLVGAIHSPYPDGRLFWPDRATPEAVFGVVAGYLGLALLTGGAGLLAVRRPAD